MQSATDQGIDRFGGIDIVIANAGIATFGSVLNVDPAAFKTVLDVNAARRLQHRSCGTAVGDRAPRLCTGGLVPGGYAPVAGLAAYSLTKAGVEHFANSLRLEVGHRGVDVGSAHMCWIDTPLVQEGKAESAAFGDMIANLPAPLNKTASVEKCGEAFVKGIEGRKRQINYPGWVRVFRWLRPLLTTKVGERQLVNGVPKRMAQMDAEAAALGRSMSERTQALEER